MKRIRKTTAVGLALAALAVAPLAHADAKPAAPPAAAGDDLSLSDLLNIKLQTGSFLELDLAKSPLSMTIIDREKIDLAGANNMTELLEIYVPGFQYMYNKWNGIIWGMRGVANDRNAKFIVLVNGHKMNTEARDGFFSETTMGLFGDVERIEVLRGPAGLVYGSGAIAGVINVVTRDVVKSGAELEAKGRTWSTGFGNTQTSLQGTVFGKISDEQSFTGSLGFAKSDGIGYGEARTYGNASWPYPGWVAPKDQPITTGVPNNGSFESTPGDWKASADYKWKNLRLYGRFTHQDQQSAGLFPKNPWPTLKGSAGDAYATYKSLAPVQKALQDSIAPLKKLADDKTATDDQKALLADLNYRLALVNYKLAQLPSSVRIDGKTVGLDDPFWSQVSGGDNQRRDYVSDNIALDATYDIPFGENNLKLHAAFDGNTDRLQTQSMPGYDNTQTIGNEANTSILESFGERRYTFGAMYLWKTVPKLQLAAGAEQRFDDLGEDLSGRDAENENPLHLAVSKVLYTNTAIYAEGFYTFNEKWGVDFGARWDGHTRTIDNGGTFNGKLAGIYTPVTGHTIKAIFQSSSNNGTDDNYEYARWQIDDQGKTSSAPHFPDATAPGSDNNKVIPGATEDELHKLKPEKVYSFELTSTDELGHGFSVSPSISYNIVQDLFLWNQTLFRVVNAGGYNFVNFDLQADYKGKKFDVGFNHTAQYVVNTSVTDQATAFTVPFDAGDKGVKQADGTYVPTPGLSSQIVLNPVHDNVTQDGSTFYSLNSNVSKLYANYHPNSTVTLHTDFRVFWGLTGRDSAYNADEAKGYNYLSINTDPSIKWNASAHFKLPQDWTVSLFVYDILGVNDSNGDATLATNTARWQQMGAPGQNEVYSVDLRSYAINIKKAF